MECLSQVTRTITGTITPTSMAMLRAMGMLTPIMPDMAIPMRRTARIITSL
jgi:hypothetical protein